MATLLEVRTSVVRQYLVEMPAGERQPWAVALRHRAEEAVEFADAAERVMAEMAVEGEL